MIINQSSQPMFTSSSNPQDTSSAYSLKGFKLPDIRLSKFDGNPLEWNKWFELNQTAIGKIPRISPVEKITYLQTLCTGSAKSLIESYGTNSSQYGQANEELIRRIGSSKFIVTAYIEHLEDFEHPHLQTFLLEVG